MFLSLLFNAGPLQSWGYGSYKKNRNTKLYPTQSAVVGMICRASGMYTSKIGQNNFVDFLEKIQQGKFHSILFKKNSVMTDFQTIGTNYKNDQIYKADDKLHGSTVIVNKQYLENAISGCIIESDDIKTLKYILESFKSPESFIGIGRSCCIPTSPIADNIYTSFKDAFISLAGKAKTNEDDIIKLVSPSVNGSSINDVMIGHQQFVSRLVTEEDRTLAEWKKKIN